MISEASSIPNAKLLNLQCSFNYSYIFNNKSYKMWHTTTLNFACLVFIPSHKFLIKESSGKYYNYYDADVSGDALQQIQVLFQKATKPFHT